jgi:ABC-type Fe3+/spermidine/putrescine transport system ATPase subunit
MTPLLDISRLTHGYGSAAVLADFSLTITAGEHRALTGPSGCGKSTLLRLIAGLDTPQCGTISLTGILATDGPRLLLPPHRRGLAMVFQDLALWPNLNALANVELGLASAALTRQEKQTRAAESLALCHISDLSRRRPAQLSGGQQQRVALARALAVRPRLLLLDEPFTGLDDTLKWQLVAEVRSLASRHGITIIAATHDLSEAAALGCEVIKASMTADKVPPASCPPD